MLFAVYIYLHVPTNAAIKNVKVKHTYVLTNLIASIHSPIYSDFHPDGTKIIRGVFSDRASEKSECFIIKLTDTSK
jgi:hypothetical protein